MMKAQLKCYSIQEKERTSSVTGLQPLFTQERLVVTDVTLTKTTGSCGWFIIKVDQ